MSTRAVYTFIEDDDKFHVYKHHDGYPSGAAGFIQMAKDKAWPLPRFEAADFAAAFVAANKDGGGGVYFTHGPDHHGDLEFRYEVDGSGAGAPVVRAYTMPDGHKIWEGLLTDVMPLSAVEA